MRAFVTFSLLVYGFSTCVRCADYVPGSKVEDCTFGDVDKCNQFIDGLTEELTRRYADEIDPYRFPNKTRDLGIFGSLKLRMWDAKVSGLTKLRRFGPCFISITEGSHRVKVTLGTGQLDLNAQVYTKLGFGEKELHVSGVTDKTRSVLHLDVRDGRPYLDDLEVTDRGYIDFSTDTETMMDKFFNAIVDYVAIIWKKSIEETIENKIESLIDEMLSND